MATARVRPLISDLVQDQLVRPITAHRTQRSVDAVVSVNTRYPTIQSAIDAGHKTIVVKSGTYAGFTANQASSKIRLEPGTIITSAVTLSAVDVTLEAGSGCDLQGLVSITATHCSFLCKNGVTTAGVDFSEREILVDGGGWGTVHTGPSAGNVRGVYGSVNLPDSICMNFTAETDAVVSACYVLGNRCPISGIKTLHSASVGIAHAGKHSPVLGCFVVSADSVCLYGMDDEELWLGNASIVGSTSNLTMTFSSAAENCVVVGNVASDPSGTALKTNSGADDCVLVGNRADGAVTGAASAVIASNDETSF